MRTRLLCTSIGILFTIHSSLSDPTAPYCGKTTGSDPLTRIKELSPFVNALIYLGDETPPDQETSQLLKALETARFESQVDSYKELEQFCANFPRSRWLPSLDSNLGARYRQ